MHDEPHLNCLDSSNLLNGPLYKLTSRLLWLSRCATSPPAVSQPEQQLQTGTRFGQCDKENTRVYLFAKALVPLVPLKPWQNIKGRRARSELESKFSQRSSIAVALADACLQTESGRVKAWRYACLCQKRSNLEDSVI